jgi:hypothetical protein
MAHDTSSGMVILYTSTVKAKVDLSYYKLHFEDIITHSFSNDEFDETKMKDNTKISKYVLFEEMSFCNWNSLLFNYCKIHIPYADHDNIYYKKIYREIDFIVSSIHNNKFRKVILSNFTFYDFIVFVNFGNYIHYKILTSNKYKGYNNMNYDKIRLCLVTNSIKEYNLLATYTPNNVSLIYGDHKPEILLETYTEYVYFNLSK